MLDSVAPVKVAEYTILITDETLLLMGDPITDWTTLDVTLRFNEPGSGELILPGYQYVIDQLVDQDGMPAGGRRVAVIRDMGAASGVAPYVLIAGPVEKWLHERSDDGDNASYGKLTINFADDLALIAARCAYPDPTVAAGSQAVDNWTFTGNAELAIRSAVNLNAGPGALAPRIISQLALGTLASVGTSVTVKATRMQPLADLLRNIALTGGNLGFRTRQSGNQILFEVYQPPDKSGSIRFGFGLGNMQYVAYEVSAPTVTTAIVGGQGTGASSLMIERANAADEASWGRFEKLVARDGSGALQGLQDDGDRELAQGASTRRLPATVSDIPDQRFGQHYQLGDIVSIETAEGKSYADIVATVHLQAWSTAGEFVVPTVGSQAAATDPMWVQTLRDIDQRLGRVERTVVPA